MADLSVVPGLRQSWMDIEAWMLAHASGALERLNQSADSEALTRLRSVVPPDTPEALLDLLSIHDGEATMGGGSILPDFELLPVELVLEQYRYHLRCPDDCLVESAALVSSGHYQTRGPVCAVGNHSRRIPFATCNGDAYWHVDLIPAVGGLFGQIVQEDIEDGRWVHIATSLEALFASYLIALTNGDVYPDNEGQMCNDEGRWPQEWTST